MTQVTVNLAAYNGQTFQLRWHEGNDSTANVTGWYVDTVALTNVGTAAACAAGSGRPPEVTASGNPGSMTVAKGSTAGTVVLNIADMAGATGYNVYEGVLPMTAGTPYTHGAAGNVCAATTTLATGRRTTAAAGIGTAGSHYYLVTQFTTAEGPSGFNSSAVEINAALNTCAP